MGFFDGNSKSAAFDQPGDSIKGKVTEWTEVQQTDYTTKEPKWWDAEKTRPVMKAIITLDTDQRADDDDDGRRAVHVSSKFMRVAVVDAVKRSGAKAPEQGGTLTVTYTKDDPNSRNPRTPAKMYSATYERPSTTFGTGQLATQPAPAQSASKPQQDPWASDPLTGEQRSKLSQLEAIGGLDDATVAAALGVTVAVLAQARGEEVI